MYTTNYLIKNWPIKEHPLQNTKHTIPKIRWRPDFGRQIAITKQRGDNQAQKEPISISNDIYRVLQCDI